MRGFKRHEKDFLMSSDIAIKVNSLGKCYQIYDTPRDRLKQFIMPKIQRLFGQAPQNYFKEFWALKDVSLIVKKGETVGIIGRNGSGKSTILQIICGTLQATSGTVETNGRIAALLELGSGFNPEFTGRENVYMNASILGLTTNEINEKFDEIANFADIGDFIEQPVKVYSSGMVVRLAFAVIVHVDADILVIDEALSVGDAFFVQKCMRFLRNFMKAGTVLFVSHDTGSVLNLCDKALLLHEGIEIEQGDPKNITERYLEKLYGSEQVKNTVDEIQPMAMLDKEAKSLRDMRLDFINQSNLRNDIELFPCSLEAASFGNAGAKIINTQLLDKNNTALNWVVGGEQVNLVINCIAHNTILTPIIGFQIKDRLGQVIFADNTYLSFAHSPVSISKGEQFSGRFQFVMPLMPVGDYSISPAIAEGTQEEHIQHHWVHDALTFKVHSSSVCLGLVGLPMSKIELIKL